ncbi:hypothetical protein J5X98_00505 [Leptothermofonsia sichuanensis E412]|uniref:hypothetical protein n=1 Tax=Leptothermofonsia sichuanensis TaxID=2917832 RepID=UPI001CA609B7|nr:hypothetical protein [Leptothermofonsia sichuanensis]QZZ21032.1 hypothetical protein J5X98_00505 [Leptothermofonsia sichuanensis E412]
MNKSAPAGKGLPVTKIPILLANRHEALGDRINLVQVPTKTCQFQVEPQRHKAH